MPLYRNPKTGEIYELPEKYQKSGIDTNREGAINKGYVPVQTVVNPLNPDVKFQLPETAVPGAREKGYMLPHEFQEETKQDQIFETTRIPLQSIKALAAKHGVSFEEADKMLEYAGGLPAYREADAGKYTAATAGEVLTLGLGQFIGKKQLSENEERLYDDLRNLADKHKSYLQAGLEMFAGPGFGAAKAAAKGVKAATAAGAGLGAAGGLGASEQGKELESAAYGAAIGGGLSLVLTGAGPAIRKFVQRLDEKGAKVEQELAEAGKDLEVKIAQKREENAALYAAVDENYRSHESLLDIEALDTIVKNEIKRTKTPDGPVLLSEIPPEEIAQNVLDFHALEVASQLGMKIKGKPARNTLKGKSKLKAADKDAQKRAYAARTYINEVSKTADGPQRIKLAERAARDIQIVAKELGAEARKKVELSETSLGGRIFDFISDGKFVARSIDRRLGTDMEGILSRDFAKGYAALSRFEFIGAGQIQKIRKDVQKLFDSEEQFTNILENKALFSKATPEQQVVLKEAQDLFEEFRVNVNELGLPITKFEDEALNYVPNQTVGAIEAIPLLQGRVRELNEKYGVNLFGDVLEDAQFKKLLDEDEAFKELVDSVGVLNATKVNGPKMFKKQLTMATTPGKGSTPAQHTEAAAAFLREGKIPELIREKNFTKLSMRWLVNTHRHAIFQKPIAELRRVRDLAIAANDERAAKYVNNLLDDLTGLREGTLATWSTKYKQKMQLKLYDQAQNSASRSSRVLAQMFLNATDLTNVFTTMPYASWLGGANVKPLITNLSQTLTFTFPELGPGLAGKAAPRVLRDMAKMMAKGEEIVIKSPELLKSIQKNPKLSKLYGDVQLGDTIRTKNISMILGNERLLGQSWNNEMLEAMREGMMTSAASQKIRGAIQKYSDGMLFAYQRTEWANRYIAYRTGKNLGNLIVKGDKDALRYVGKELPLSLRRKVLEAANDNSPEQVQSLMTDWLIDTTILNYNRASLSQYGRTMGPLFSMFTKWPTSISADLVDSYQRQGFAKGTYRNVMKYGAPWALLALADTVAGEMMGEHRAKELGGSAGFQGMAPIGSAKSVLNLEVFNAPALDVGQTFLKAVGSGDPQVIARYLDRQIMTFVPGPVLLEQLMGDLPALIYDEPKTPLLPLSGGGPKSTGLRDVLEP